MPMILTESLELRVWFIRNEPRKKNNNHIWCSSDEWVTQTIFIVSFFLFYYFCLIGKCLPFVHEAVPSANVSKEWSKWKIENGENSAYVSSLSKSVCVCVSSISKTENLPNKSGKVKKNCTVYYCQFLHFVYIYRISFISNCFIWKLFDREFLLTSIQRSGVRSRCPMLVMLYFPHSFFFRRFFDGAFYNKTIHSINEATEKPCTEFQSFAFSSCIACME